MEGRRGSYFHETHLHNVNATVHQLRDAVLHLQVWEHEASGLTCSALKGHPCYACQG